MNVAVGLQAWCLGYLGLLVLPRMSDLLMEIRTFAEQTDNPSLCLCGFLKYFRACLVLRW